MLITHENLKSHQRTRVRLVLQYQLWSQSNQVQTDDAECCVKDVISTIYLLVLESLHQVTSVTVATPMLQFWKLHKSPLYGPGSSVGIATGYGLNGPGIESRWRRDFPSVQTGPGTHQASCTMGTGSFPGLKCGRGVLLTTHPLLAPRSWKSRALPLLPLGHNRACNGVTLPFLPYINLHYIAYIQFVPPTEQFLCAEKVEY
jgi:hypothetical protein